jgi:hypothetical protein
MAVENFGPGWAGRLGKKANKQRKAQMNHEALSRAQSNAANTAEKSRYPEPEEGIRCRTCGVKYTGSMTEHFTTH